LSIIPSTGNTDIQVTKMSDSKKQAAISMGDQAQRLVDVVKVFSV